MKKYSMPWPAMKTNPLKLNMQAKVAKVEFIPYLVIIDQKGEIITKDGKK